MQINIKRAQSRHTTFMALEPGEMFVCAPFLFLKVNPTEAMRADGNGNLEEFSTLKEVRRVLELDVTVEP